MNNEKERGISLASIGALANGDLENAMVASTPGGIEKQEAEGQQTLCTQELIPIEMNGCEKEDFEKMGIEFVGESDDLFYKCILPKGWKVQPTEHSMWSNLIDDKGKEKASIFYKAAFYDRRAFISLKQD